jgi:hypothetical protein
MRGVFFGFACGSLFIVAHLLAGIQSQLKELREELHSARVAQEQTCEVGDE